MRRTLRVSGGNTVTACYIPELLEDPLVLLAVNPDGQQLSIAEQPTRFKKIVHAMRLRKTRCPKGLLSLPVELLQHIATFLAREHQATLAFTCKHLAHSTGTTSWGDYKNPFKFFHNPEGIRQSKRNFLLLLARDLDPAATVICFGHRIIHTTKLHYYPTDVSALDQILAFYTGEKKKKGVRRSKCAHSLTCKYDFRLATLETRLKCWAVQPALAGSIPIRPLAAFERLSCRLLTHIPGTLASARIAHDATMYCKIVRGKFIVAMQLRICIPSRRISNHVVSEEWRKLLIWGKRAEICCCCCKNCTESLGGFCVGRGFWGVVFRLSSEESW